jgi:hypothetical protein
MAGIENGQTEYINPVKATRMTNDKPKMSRWRMTPWLALRLTGSGATGMQDGQVMGVWPDGMPFNPFPIMAHLCVL